ncbi:Fur family transcriptional regulator, ferric uptake regulator [Zhouia amylolytica]|uniref:Fur family transcriptional regulator, ferric uptake regulator n=1 Tax=Zhouia amylolytica TaxID=376730 RepID=A0A1I6PJM1_9FLAO|nr:transcriptional repressor [Zhouia amylolytica]SFS40350.1 Fur family transcriptional regulator, ferric uptake regulator [Zhouia amylolytica]
MSRRNTKSQQEVLDILKQSGLALNHEMIQEQMSLNTDRATIYRILNRFSQDGIVHKVVGDDGKQYFAFCSNCTKDGHQHNHFHFRCIECQNVICIKNELRVQLPEGYEPINFNGVISGYCSKCCKQRNGV